MPTSEQLLAKLEAGLSDASGVYIHPGENPAARFEELRNTIRRHKCEPFRVDAKVMPPGFPDIEVGATVSGYCVAKDSGYWLVYAPEKDTFYCFWGVDEGNLGAHGVFGGPLYCWSA